MHDVAVRDGDPVVQVPEQIVTMIAPALLVPEFVVNVQLVSVKDPFVWTPPTFLAVFDEKVQLIMVAVDPASTYAPAPLSDHDQKVN